MTSREVITVEGLTPDQILSLSAEDFDALILTDKPVVFQAGTATILGRFACQENKLIVELGHIDGGGEGILPLLWSIAERYSQEHSIDTMEWIVHAVTCDPPNPRLRKLLERRGFVVKDIPDIGPVYYYLTSVGLTSN